MIALIQRASRAHVEVAGKIVGAVDLGLLALIGIQPSDTSEKASRLLDRLLGYRIFDDERGRMNLSLAQVQGGLLLVPQFTLAADTQTGMRPSFTSAANPDLAKTLFEDLLKQAHARHPKVASGIFGATMRIHLINEGPATFWLES
jgi:D-tyrosyl-tRNA(Tyr) deacylase